MQQKNKHLIKFMILPLPEQSELEREIHNLFLAHRDSIETCSRYLRRGSSNLSRQINPSDRSRPNPFFTVLEILWALDCFCPELSDALWALMQRERERWRVNCASSQENFAILIEKIFDEFKDVVKCEMTGASLEKRFDETLQLREAVDGKINHLQSMIKNKLEFVTEMAQ